jgi:hypothetical protein
VDCRAIVPNSQVGETFGVVDVPFETQLQIVVLKEHSLRSFSALLSIWKNCDAHVEVLEDCIRFVFAEADNTLRNTLVDENGFPTGYLHISFASLTTPTSRTGSISSARIHSMFQDPSTLTDTNERVDSGKVVSDIQRMSTLVYAQIISVRLSRFDVRLADIVTTGQPFKHLS